MKRAHDEAFSNDSDIATQPPRQPSFSPSHSGVTSTFPAHSSPTSPLDASITPSPSSASINHTPPSSSPGSMRNYKNAPMCTICGTPEYVIEDLRNGCVVCTSCGLQIGGQIISEGAEWRTFADDGSKNNADPSRVGGIDDSVRGLGTTMAGGGSLGHRHNQASLTSEQQVMERVLRLCKTYQKRLNLENQIYIEAERICKQVVEAPVELRGKALKQDTLAAVCIHLACRNKSQDRKKSDVVAVADVNEKAFNKQFQRVNTIIHSLSRSAAAVIGVDAPKVVPRFDAINFVQRFGRTLGLARETVSIAECVVMAARDLDIMGSAQPGNLAIAALYFVYLIEGEPDSTLQKRMQNVASINADTLIKLTKLFYDKRSLLVPSEYRPAEVIERMPRPEKQK